MIKRTAILGVFFRATDTITIVLAGTIAHVIKYGDLAIPNRFYLFMTVLLFLTLNIFSAFSVYRGWRSKSLFTEITRLTLCWALVILSTGTLTFLTKTGAELSREWVILTFAIAYIGFIGIRIIFRHIIRHLQEAGYNQKQIIIIGAGNLGQRACDAMQQQTWAGLIPIAFFDDALHGHTFNDVEVKAQYMSPFYLLKKKGRPSLSTKFG